MATPPASTAKPAAAAQAPTYQNIDRPELPETFADTARPNGLGKEPKVGSLR